jgi:hypothetical protein
MQNVPPKLLPMDYLKWKMSEKDMNSFIKSWEDCEIGLDLLIIKQQIRHKKMLNASERTKYLTDLGLKK